MSAKDCIPLFPSEEIPNIFDLIQRYAPSLKKKNETEHEESLSNRLYKLIIKDEYIRNSPFTPQREARVYDDSSDSHTGQIDFNFICSGGVDTYFAIEAKRLHVTFKSGWQSLVSEYVAGDQGMMCFISGKYSEFQKAGGMLGYVFDGDLQKAKKGIEGLISKNHKKLKLDNPKKIKSSSIPDVDQTKHLLDSRLFTIYHLLISV